MFTAIAALIVLFLNAGIVPAVQYEDDPIVAVMSEVAQGALTESGCTSTGWDFNRDNSAGLEITAKGDCESAAQFYRSPETGLWQFAIEGS